MVLFLCHLGSRRQITHRLRTKASAQTCKALFGAVGVAHGDTVANLCKRLTLSQVEAVPTELTEKLIRNKVLYQYRICNRYFLIAMDGTRTISFKHRHCESCLTQTQNEKTTYFHPVLEAKLVTSNGFAFSMMSEFIENADPGATKQDCEWKAFLRLAPRLQKRFPKLPICLALDGLFAGGDIFALCAEYGWKYFISLKDKDLLSVNEEFDYLKKFQSENQLSWRTGKKAEIHQQFSWAEDIHYIDSKKREHLLNVVECLETEKDKTTKFKWLTNFNINKSNVIELCNSGGRLRWVIENEGFNSQKTGGYHLEHPYSQNMKTFKAFYFLMQIAHLLFQLLAKGSLLKKSFPKGFGSLKNLALSLLEAWRTRAVSPQELIAISTTQIQIRFDDS